MLYHLHGESPTTRLGGALLASLVGSVRARNRGLAPSARLRDGGHWGEHRCLGHPTKMINVTSKINQMFATRCLDVWGDCALLGSTFIRCGLCVSEKLRALARRGWRNVQAERQCSKAQPMVGLDVHCTLVQGREASSYTASCSSRRPVVESKLDYFPALLVFGVTCFTCRIGVYKLQCA